MSFGGLVRIGGTCPFDIFLVGLGVDFVHAVKADAYVLPWVDKLNKLFHRAVELSDDVLYRQHHTECHISVYYGCGCKYGNEDVLHLIDGDASCLLHLLQIERLQIDLKQVGLYVLPFPTFALLAPLQLDFLHTANELIGYIAVTTCLLKVFVVKLSTFSEEENYPACIKRCS